MQKRVKGFFGITFSFILLASLVHLVLAEEIDWRTPVNNAMMSIPQGTTKYQQANEIYLKFYDDFDKLHTEYAQNLFAVDPEAERCANACGDMPTGGNPEDIDIDNPDAWHQQNAMTFDQWDACRKKCNAEAKARDDQKYAELNEKVRQLAEKAIADINAIKSGSKVTPESDPTNPDYNRGRGPDQRINPSFGGYLGDAYVVRSDGTKVIPGKELYLKVEDKLTTGKNSKLNFIFKDVGGINLGQNTELRVGNALLDQYYLARGTLKTQINWGTLPPQKLEFHTPNAVINVKGTEFIIDYNETSNVTVVYLNEGNLEVEIRNQIVNLAAGNYLVLNSDGSVWKYPLKSEKWAELESNFYEPIDFSRAFNYSMLVIDFIVVFILSLWMRKKVKNPDKKDKSTSKGTASLVLALLGAIFMLIAPYIGIIFSAIGFCLARIQKANNPTVFATLGLVLCFIGLISNLMLLINTLY